MSKTVKADVYIDLSGIERKLEPLMSDSEARLAIHDTLAKMCDPYVPFWHGDLSQDLEISSDYVKYTVEYAHYQYYGVNFNHTLEHHPLATAKWDEAMMADKGEEFQEEVKKILVRRYKQLYG